MKDLKSVGLSAEEQSSLALVKFELVLRYTLVSIKGVILSTLSLSTWLGACAVASFIGFQMNRRMGNALYYLLSVLSHSCSRPRSLDG